MPINPKKVYTALGLVLSSLAFPWSIIYYFLIFPMLYTGGIVPFFLWKNLFEGKMKDVPINSLLWKIPTITLLYLVLNIGELSIFYILSFLSENLTIRILVVMFIIFILRIVTYAEMLWVWQPLSYKNFSKMQWLFIGLIIVSIIVACYFVVSNIDRYRSLLIFLQNAH